MTSLRAIARKFTPEPIRMMRRRLCMRSDGERQLRERFARFQGGELDLDNANTFTKKLYRRMIERNRERDETFMLLADKYQARDYIRKTVGDECLVPLLWSGTDPSKIPFDRLPERCVAKANHGSGMVLILTPQIDRREAIETMHGWLRENYYWASLEYSYYGIKPRIIIEEFLDDGDPLGPFDYRTWCFHGKPEAIQVDNHAHSLNAFYTPAWQLTDCTYRSQEGIREVSRPINLEQMVSIASKLSKPFDFVRVDLYNVGGKIYCGELTFSPTGGANKFYPSHWDLWFGEKWTD